MMKLLCATGAVALLAAAPASAVAYQFTLTTGSTIASFVLNSNPTPDNVSGKGFFAVYNVAGTYNGVAGFANIDFFQSGGTVDGGIELDVPGGNAFFVRGGPQLFSGTLAAPVFSVNTFTLAADPSQRQATLTISAIGGVPEPASWAMMIAGFGVVGFALRRRAVAVRFA